MFRDKFTILIGTCDKYQFLWDNFVTIFNRYWAHDIDVEKYFISETIKPEFDGFNAFTPGNVSYSDCLRYALNRVNTPYVLWLQDDYFLRKTLTKTQFIGYFEMIEAYNVDCLFPNRGTEKDTWWGKFDIISSNYAQMQQYSDYTISMQACIWNVDFFKSCLIDNGHETPWQFELDGTKRLNDTRSHTILYERSNDVWYLEAMRKGKFTNHYSNILQQEQLI